MVSIKPAVGALLASRCEGAYPVLEQLRQCDANSMAEIQGLLQLQHCHGQLYTLVN